MRGRKPKPTVLQILHGNPRKTGKAKMDAKLAIEPPDTRLEPPEDFSDSERVIWFDALASAPPGVLRRIDASVMIAWVTACDLHRRARIALRGSTLLMQIQPSPPKKKDEAAKAPNSYPIVSPLLHIINRQAQIMTKTAEQLGFTPTSRSRVIPSTNLPIALPAPAAGPATGQHVELEDYLANRPASPSMH